MNKTLTFTVRNLRLGLLASCLDTIWGDWRIYNMRWERILVGTSLFAYKVVIELSPVDYADMRYYARTNWTQYMYMNWLKCWATIKDKPTKRLNDDDCETTSVPV